MPTTHFETNIQPMAPPPSPSTDPGRPDYESPVPSLPDDRTTRERERDRDRERSEPERRND